MTTTMRAKRIAKIMAAALAATLIAALCFSLAACDKQRAQKQEAQLRASEVFAIEDALLGVMGEGWRKGMSDAQIAALPDGGDYIVAEGWLSMFGGVLNASNIQTAKLKNLADTARSADGQALLGDFSNNAELIFPLFKGVGFTQDDIGELAYGMLCSLATDSGKTLDGIYSALMRVRDLVKNDSNIMKNASSVKTAQENLVPTDAEKEELLAAFEDARGALNALVEFAYDLFNNILTDNVTENLFGKDGALQNITDGEITTVISSISANVASLKGALNADARAKLNRALDLVISNFDSDSISSVLYAQVVSYAKYAYMFVDAIPMACDLLTSVGSAVSANIAELRANIDSMQGESATSTYNLAVLAAKVVKNFMDGYDQKTLTDFFDNMLLMSGANSQNLATFDMDKAILILGIDIGLNLSDFVSGASGDEDFTIRHDVLTAEDLGLMLNSALFLRNNLYTFQEAYYRYRRGEITLAQLTGAAMDCNFESLGVVNPYMPSVSGGDIVTDRWYAYYMEYGMQAANELIARLAVAANRDIALYISDYYDEGSPYAAALDRAAKLSMASQMTDEEAAEAVQSIADSGVLGFIALLQLAADML